ALLVEDQLTAPDTAIRTNRARHLRIINARMHRPRVFRHRLRTGAIFALPYLAKNRPFPEPGEHAEHLTTFRHRRQPWSQENGAPSSAAFAQLTREFETCQRNRFGIDIFRKCQHLKSAPEHFRMK